FGRLSPHPSRHGRACPGHPRLFGPSARKTWMPGTRPGMTERWLAAFVAIVMGYPDNSSRKRCDIRLALVPVHPVDALHPFAHGLLQIVARFAELRIAAGDEFVLFTAQLTLQPRGGRLLHRADIGSINLAIEVGQGRIGADRLLHRPARGGAIEAGLALDRFQRAD